MRDPFGRDDLGDEAIEMHDQLERTRPGGAEAAAQAEEAWGHWPGIPPSLRYPENSVQIFPPRVIVPDPEDYPNINTRLHVAAGEDDSDTAISINYPMPEELTIYAISYEAWIYADGPDNAPWVGSAGGALAVVQFRRASGDELTTEAAPLSAIAGSGERPMPLATPCWAFKSNQNIQIRGEAAYAPWKLWIVLHCTESIAATNLGMSRTRQYTRKGRR